jgi:iron complex outermembrane recepter protein
MTDKSVLFILLFSAPVFAQTDSLRTQQLAPVTVTTTRLETKETQIPMAMTVLDGSRIKTGQPQLSLFESLGAVPGLFAQNPDNYGQGLRISMRGFGARAAFGIRGIRLVVDGIPESTPDGQADVGNIDPSMMSRMEVVRGPSSSLYGNAAGGVINLTTDNAADLPLVELKATAGSFGFRNLTVKTALQKAKFGYVLSATHNEVTGYRANSQMQNNILNAKLRYDFDSLTRLSVLVNYGNSPTDNDPGGLTAAQVTENRQQAQPNNLKFGAGKHFEQGRIGLVFEKKIGHHLIFARAFATKRTLSNFLAFQAAGAGSVDRVFGGGSLQYQFSYHKNKVSYRIRAGLDAENQNDTRRRFDNLAGERGKMTLDQLEQFKNVALFLTQDLAIGRMSVLAGVRYDNIKQQVTDFFLTDGDQSGERAYQIVNPTLGITYLIGKQSSVYANVGTSFESPAMSELSNNPTGVGGFNADLNPQRATNLEIGTKLFIHNRLRLDVALFTIGVQDELVPFQIAGQTGRVFYRNAGESKRQGLELGISTILTKGLTLHGSYTYSDFKYKTYQTTVGKFDGNALPGIPKQMIYGELRYFNQSGFYAIAQVRNVSDFFADDANAITANGYTVSNFRVGKSFGTPKRVVGRGSKMNNEQKNSSIVIRHSSFVFEPFLGLNNAFDVSYFQNIQINASANRYFEPAVGRYWFGGIKIGF